MVFGLLRKLRGAFLPFKDASQGMRYCGTFRDFQEIERGHVSSTGITCFMYIYT